MEEKLCVSEGDSGWQTVAGGRRMHAAAISPALTASDKSEVVQLQQQQGEQHWRLQPEQKPSHQGKPLAPSRGRGRQLSLPAVTAGKARLMEPAVAAKLAGLGERVAAGHANTGKPGANAAETSVRDAVGRALMALLVAAAMGLGTSEMSVHANATTPGVNTEVRDGGVRDAVGRAMMVKQTAAVVAVALAYLTSSGGGDEGEQNERGNAPRILLPRRRCTTESLLGGGGRFLDSDVNVAGHQNR